MRMKNKKILLVFFLLILTTLIVLCNNGSKEDSKLSLDELYDELVNISFTNATQLGLNYGSINDTLIYIGEQGLGTRDTIAYGDGTSSQRIICYNLNDGTNVNITIGDVEINNKNNIATFYQDELKNIGLEEGITFSNNVDSTVYIVDSFIINIVFSNTEEPIDVIEVAKFKEEFVGFIYDLYIE